MQMAEGIPELTVAPLKVVNAELGHIPEAVSHALILLDASQVRNSIEPTTPTSLEFQGKTWQLRYFTGELTLRRVLVECEGQNLVAVFMGDGDFPLPMDVRERAFRGGMRPITERSVLQAATDIEWPPLFEDGAWAPMARRRLDLLQQAAQERGPKILNERDLAELLTRDWLRRTDLGAPPEAYFAAGILRAGDPPLLPLEIKLISETAGRVLNEPFRALFEWCLQSADRFAKAFESLLKIHAYCRAKDTDEAPSWYALDPVWMSLVKGLHQPEAVRLRYTRQLSEITPPIAALLPVEKVQDQAGRVERDFVRQELVPKGSPLFREEYTRAKKVLFDALRLVSPIDPQEAVTCTTHPAAGKDPERDLLEHLLRVRRWLDTTPEPAADQPLPAAAALQWYWKEGAFVDLELQRAWAITLHQLPNALIQRQAWEMVWNAAMQRRDVYNKRFADTLAKDYKGEIHQQGVVNTAKVLDWVVLPQIEKGKRSLLLVLDGLSVPQFHYLHESLVEAGLGVGEEHLGCALLPSVTSVSRKAIFMGQMPVEDTVDDEDEYAQRSRQAEPQQLKAYAQKHGFVAEYYRGDVAKAATALTNASVQLVAVVLNTFDDALKQKDVGPDLRGLTEVDGLSLLISQALANGRVVYIVSDHGHTLLRPDFGLGMVKEAESRYFVGHVPAAQQESHVHLVDANVAGAKEEGAGFLYRAGVYFGQKTRGAHGGCSLEEMAVPLVTIVQRGRALQYPSWWEMSGSQGGQVATPDESDGSLTITLVDDRHCSLPISPAQMSSEERTAMQYMARHRLSTTADLAVACALPARRVGTVVASLLAKLAQAGLQGLIEERGRTDQGEQFEFHAELLD